MLYCVFLQLLLKYDCVDVYRRLKNYLKNFFSSKFVNCLLSSVHQAKIFLVVLDTMHQKDDSGECCGFYHHSNVVEHKNEGERQKCHGYICIYGISFSFTHKVE